MDELTFQEELRELKQRVSEMSLNSHQYLHPSASRPPSSAQEQDMFIQELQSLKSQVDGLQLSLGQRHQRWSDQAGISPQPQSPDYNNTRFQFPPSVPIFWQLFTALKTDVRNIDQRVSNLETGFSDLEDRVDRLEPIKYTPPGSETGSEETHEDYVAVPSVDGRHEVKPQARADSNGPTPARLPRSPHEEERIEARCVPEGTVFRDKEIARLDELLRASSETSKAHEQALAQKDAQIALLEQSTFEIKGNAAAWERFAKRRHHELEEAKDSVRKAQAELSACEDSRHHFMTKYVDENHRVGWFKQELSRVLRRSEAKIATLEDAVQTVESTTREECREALANRDYEIEKLLGFCEQKDLVVKRHEEIVQRGARMLAERDVEIERLRDSLSKSEDTTRHAREHNAKLISTLRKRDSEIEDLRDEINEERVRYKKAAAGVQREADILKRRSMPAMVPSVASARTQIAEPFAEAARAANNGNRLPIPLAPRSIRGYSRLPHEEDRALLWEQGAIGSTRHHSGAVSQIRGYEDSASKAHSLRQTAVDVPLARRHDIAAERSDSPRADHRAVRFQPDTAHKFTQSRQTMSRSSGSSDFSASNHAVEDNRERITRNEAQPSTTRTSSRRRSRHPLPMDATLWPPLPAPVAVDPVGNQRTAARADAQPSNGRSAIAKPASMPELLRKTPASLQAYVETEAEAESGDDGAADGSLLD